MAALFPDGAELGAITTLAEMVDWSDVPGPAWTAVSAGLGTVPDYRTYASLPAVSLRARIMAARVDPDGQNRGLTPVEATQVGLVWGLARHRVGLPYVDPIGPPAGPAVQQTGQGMPMDNVGVSAGTLALTWSPPLISPAASRRIKFCHLIEQANEADELLLATELDDHDTQLQEARGVPRSRSLTPRWSSARRCTRAARDVGRSVHDYPHECA